MKCAASTRPDDGDGLEETHPQVAPDEEDEHGLLSAETENKTPEIAEKRSVLKQTEKSKSFNDRHQIKKFAETAGTSLPNGSAPRSELDRRSRRRESTSKSDAELEPSSPPSARDVKPQRPGTLPKYDFTFRCVERAEKRKEFFSKLEEKIHAKEVQKSTLEAKAKEKEEAEIKQLRKSLIFKASPMPSFYQEPPPPKPQLKKIPTTKPKSPKLSIRRRTPATSDSDGQSSCSACPGRHSLDSKISKNKGSRGTSPVQEKQAVRKSIPKMPLENNSSLAVQENFPDNIQEKSSPSTDEAVKCEEHEKRDSATATESTAFSADRH